MLRQAAALAADEEGFTLLRAFGLLLEGAAPFTSRSGCKFFVFLGFSGEAAPVQEKSRSRLLKAAHAAEFSQEAYVEVRQLRRRRNV